MPIVPDVEWTATVDEVCTWLTIVQGARSPILQLSFSSGICNIGIYTQEYLFD